MDDHDERIRARAHDIWEAEGRPEGREYSHWLRARAEIHEEEGEAVREEHGGLILRPDLGAPATPRETLPRQKETLGRASKADIARNTLPPGTVPENPTAENPDRIARLKPVRAKKPIDGRDIDAQLDQPS